MATRLAKPCEQEPDGTFAGRPGAGERRLRRERWTPCFQVVFLLGLALLPQKAAAHLIVLTDASVLKVEAFEVDGDEAVLTFALGGRMRMSMLRVERVVDDEVVPEPEKSADKLESAGAPFEVRFVEGQPRPLTAYGEIIFAAAKKHGVNPQLVAAVIRAESAFDPRAISPKGARGLMQLMPATGKRYGVRPAELFQPEKNIDAGVRYLAFLSKKFDGDLPKVLAGYNAGEGAVDRYRGIPPYRETQGYVKRILGYLGLPLALVASATGAGPR